MSELDFFGASAPMPLDFLCLNGGAEQPDGTDPSQTYRPVWSLCRAGPLDVSFFVDLSEPDELAFSRAGACFVAAGDVPNVPPGTLALVTKDPFEAFHRLGSMLQPDKTATSPTGRPAGVSEAVVHPEARLEQGVLIDMGVVIGARAEIGAGTSIGAHTVIGAGVRIGRGCRIDSQVTLRNALIGDRVMIHAGARVGMSTPHVDRALATPRLGRVIIQDDAEIGPNAVVDRGRAGDTWIGDRARIGALVFVEGGRRIDRCRSVGVEIFSSAQEMG